MCGLRSRTDSKDTYARLWPAPAFLHCRQRTQLDTTAILATPWDDKVGPGRTDTINPCSYRRADSESASRISSSSRGAAGMGRGSSSLLSTNAGDGVSDIQRWCVLYAVEPFDNSPQPRMAQIGERWFPTAIDQER